MTHGIDKSDSLNYVKKYCGYRSHNNQLRLKKKIELKQQAKNEATIAKLRTVFKDYAALRSTHASLVMDVKNGKSTLTLSPNRNQHPVKSYCHICQGTYVKNMTYRFENSTATLALDASLVHRIQKHSYCIPFEIANPTAINFINSFI